MNFVCFNGRFIAEEEPIFNAQNRSFRYGDGIFETIKVYHKKILFEEYHFERLLLGLQLLHITHSYSTALLSQNIVELCKKNNCSELARVRLAIYRSRHNEAEYIIEASSLFKEFVQWNQNGLTIGIYPYARKNTDAFSNLKTANFIPYVLAEKYAKENGMDDAIVLNAFDKLCDASKANIFLIKQKALFTPALHQGCINGVMRKFLIDEIKQMGYPIYQTEISEKELLEADEVFLTNSVYDMRWVKSCKGKNYACDETLLIYQKLLQPLYRAF